MGRENGCVINSEVFFWAATEGYLNILVWGQEKGYTWPHHYNYRNVVIRGHLDVILYFKSDNYDWSQHNICRHAARHRYLDMLIWARAVGYEWNKARCLELSKKYPRTIRMDTKKLI